MEQEEEEEGRRGGQRRGGSRRKGRGSTPELSTRVLQSPMEPLQQPGDLVD